MKSDYTHCLISMLNATGLKCKAGNPRKILPQQTQDAGVEALLTLQVKGSKDSRKSIFPLCQALKAKAHQNLRAEQIKVRAISTRRGKKGNRRDWGGSGSFSKSKRKKSLKWPQELLKIFESSVRTKNKLWGLCWQNNHFWQGRMVSMFMKQWSQSLMKW